MGQVADLPCGFREVQVDGEGKVVQEPFAVNFLHASFRMWQPAVDVTTSPTVHLQLSINVVRETYKQTFHERQDAGEMASLLIVALQPGG